MDIITKAQSKYAQALSFSNTASHSFSLSKNKNKNPVLEGDKNSSSVFWTNIPVKVSAHDDANSSFVYRYPWEKPVSPQGEEEEQKWPQLKYRLSAGTIVTASKTLKNCNSWYL